MGFLKGRIEDYSSPLAGLPARLYAGYFFFRYGLGKITRGLGGAELHETLTQWAAGPAYDFYAPFLHKVAIPHAGLFAHLVAYGEMAVGALLLLGCASRLAALGGVFLCLKFLFASGGPILSVETPTGFLLAPPPGFPTRACAGGGVGRPLKARRPSGVAW